jgi:hypothetical protein
MGPIQTSKLKVRLEQAGEIRFGPSYHYLYINDEFPEGRIFGDVIEHSPNSRYLALQEWFNIEEDKGPVTGVTLIDTEEWSCCTFNISHGKFVSGFNFKGECFLSFEEEYYPANKKILRTFDLLEIDDWKPLVLLRPRGDV